ncbi:MCE family protein [Sciscionella marina]|uniref:MCE family protein n=1 Tax=Sciscionella marina TaxID=508770 RepID=UPI000378D6DC|nr:MCE family protein [Sciscionella marina]
MKDIGVLVKLGVFLVVTSLSTVLMVNTLVQPMADPTYHYSARFTDAEGVTPGSDVRMAGVRVGRVTGVSQHDGVAQVDFEVATKQKVSPDSTVAVRYADLLGSRYLAVGRGVSLGQRLEPGSVIPLSRTTPAVDLTTLLNGFRPLFDSLEPEQANQLARSLVRVFQGEKEPIEQVLNTVVSLTSKITKDDPLIGALLDNLNSVIGSVLGKKQQFTSLVSALGKLMRLAVDERGQISDVLDSTTRMANTLAGVTEQSGAKLTNNLTLLNQVSGQLSQHGPELVRAFGSASTGFAKLGNLTSYGSWANVYLCSVSLKLGPIDTTLPPNIHSGVCR